SVAEHNARIRSGQDEADPIEIPLALRTCPLDQGRDRVEARVSGVPLGQPILLSLCNRSDLDDAGGCSESGSDLGTYDLPASVCAGHLTVGEPTQRCSGEQHRAQRVRSSAALRRTGSTRQKSCCAPSTNVTGTGSV